MHRSGTSLVTQWLHLCGLHVGERLLGGNEWNSDGHFEDLEFLSLHEDTLSQQGLPSSGLCTLGKVTPSTYAKAKISAVLKVKNEFYRQWGWKEPRTCLFLDTYKDLLPSAKYLIVFRDYHAVVTSLLRREFQPIEQEYLSRNWFKRIGWKLFRRQQRMDEYYNAHSERFLKIWIAYNTAILNYIRNLNQEQYLVVSSDLLKKKSVEVFEYLTHKWGFSLDYRGFLTVYKENLISKTFDFKPYIRNYQTIKDANRINDLFNGYLSDARERLDVEGNGLFRV